MAMAAKQAQMSYRITDLYYDAIAITAGNALGTYVSAGEAYSFGKSVAGGIKELKYYAQERTASCPNTYWVLAGYSQGAMVVADSLSSFPEDRVVYIMFFGDPKLYLPEGEGFNPPACRGDNLSEYRVYVPDCNTDNGILGARKPYEYAAFAGRYGLWCNNNDFICGSSKNPLITRGHSLYEENGSIRDASIYALRRLNYLKRTRTILSANGAVASSLPMDKPINDANSEEKLGTVMARLMQTQYRVDSGTVVTFDASPSFNVDDEQLEYAWYLDGDLQEGSSPIFNYVFNGEDLHTVRVVTSDASGASSTAEAKVYVDWVIESALSLPVPVDIYAERCGEKRICISWVRKRGSGQYLEVRVNDYLLGYVDVANEELVIDDVDFSDINVAMGYMDSGYNMGEMAELEIEGIDESVPDPVINPVPTSTSLPWWRILAIAGLPFGFVLLVKVIVKFVKDAKRV